MLGPADGHVVVLVHGALVGRQCLVREARALAESGYRVLLPDLPGHGSRWKETLTLDTAINTLRDVITKEAPNQRVVMAGFSMGGFVTAAFAAQHPELLAGAVLAACAHNARTFSWRVMGHLSDFVYKVCSYETKSGFIYKTAHMDVKRDDIQECFLRAGAEFDAWGSCWRLMYDVDMFELLPRIQSPVLIVAGERDFRSAECQYLKLMKHGQSLVLTDGEHAFTAQPDVVLEYRKQLLSWLSNINWVTGEGPAVGAEAPMVQGGQGTAGNAKVAGVGNLIKTLWEQRK